jgi:hypothetical protein
LNLNLHTSLRLELRDADGGKYGLEVGGILLAYTIHNQLRSIHAIASTLTVHPVVESMEVRCCNDKVQVKRLGNK